MTHAFLCSYIRYIIAADSTVTGLEVCPHYVSFRLGYSNTNHLASWSYRLAWVLDREFIGQFRQSCLVLIGLFVGGGIPYRNQLRTKVPSIACYRLSSIFVKPQSSWLSGLVRRFFISLSGLFGFFSQILEGDGGICGRWCSCRFFPFSFLHQAR